MPVTEIKNKFLVCPIDNNITLYEACFNCNRARQVSSIDEGKRMRVECAYVIGDNRLSKLILTKSAEEVGDTKLWDL
jgi:hypothetical protein